MERVVLEGHIHHIKLNDRLNIISISFIKQLNRLLDEVEATSGPAAVILSSSNPLIFSAGLDLKVLLNASEADREKFLNEFVQLMRRIICFPVPTLCLVDGKCIAGGVFLSLAFDYRVGVDSEKTYFHLNELDNNLPLPAPLVNVLSARTGSNHLLRTFLASFALQMSASEAAKHGMLQAAFSDRNEAMAHLLALAKKLAPKGVNREIMTQIKTNVNAAALIPAKL